MARLFSWAGALLFGVSLAFFFYSYVVTFARPSTAGAAALPVLWNAGLFTLFALHHSVFARGRVREAIATLLPAPLERSFYVWVASLLFIAVCAFWRPVPGVAWELTGAAAWVARGVQVLGVWLTLRSAAILNVRELAGLTTVGQGVSASPGEPDKAGPTYKTAGPYGWVRHPIYTGWFLMVLGVPTMTMTQLTFAAISCIYLVVAIPFEERSMRSGSDAYDRYMQQVRWRLLPHVY